MKVMQSTPRIVFVEDLVQILIDLIIKMHNKILQNTVIPEAKGLANKNLPKAEELTLEPYLISITGQYKSLKKDVSLKMQGRLQESLGTTGITPMDEKINKTKSDIKKETEKITNLETDKSRINITSKHAEYKKHKWLLIPFELAESLLMVSCFLKIGDIVIIALIVGLVIGLAQIYATKTTVLFIREIANPRKRRSYWISAAIGFTLFSLVLGTLRYYLAHTGTAAHIPFLILNPFSFAAINLLLIVTSGLIVYHYFPSKAEMEQISRLDEINNEIAKSQKLRNDLVKQHDTLLTERVKAIRVYSEMANCEKELFGKIDACFEEAVGKFIHENVIRRTDGVFPECFKHPHVLLPESLRNEFILLTEIKD